MDISKHSAITDQDILLIQFVIDLYCNGIALVSSLVVEEAKLDN